MSPVGPLGRGHGSREGVEETATLMADDKTGFIWQKCSLGLRECGSDDRLGIRILPATLETMLGGGHSREAVNFRAPGASERGSRAYSQSGRASSGRLISTKSPGQLVVEVGGARRTIGTLRSDAGDCLRRRPCNGGNGERSPSHSAKIDLKNLVEDADGFITSFRGLSVF